MESTLSSSNNLSKNDKGNPTAMIRNQLQVMRTAREKAVSDIYALDQEKKAILQIMPKVYYEIVQLQESIAHNSKELIMYDNAIEEIEKNYGEFLFSASFFEQASTMNN